ncbi:hypothetical protein PGT21_032424 [Puccinia graminis f. sp. tritici]|uniref:Uncharacterized protein n=1 Tax=Puccinia graminis f. sp. tritici TaxID=56615 RepID=A0A5B0QCG4_PUCGR|nr:hypothetical protein PGT21_032424 [Puccinia graminis f. sp. tritici]KAA1139125.1 hypothetical protein PGTUg99_036352 [Puccinia graminis f. sp. tritici]
MPCTCLSRKRKERSPSVPPLQTDLTFQDNSHFGSVSEPHSPLLKLGRGLTLLARIERAFNPSHEKVKQLISHIPASDFVRFTISPTGAPALEMDLPPPIRPESIVGCPSNSIPTRGIYSTVTKENYPQEPPGIHEAMPKHPNSVGFIHRSCGSVPKKLVLDLLPESRSHSLITPSNARKSQYAVVLETYQPLVQPPISPEPTPTFDKSNSQFQQGFHSSNLSMSSTHSAGFSPANPLPQYATVLRPCFGELLTPPLTPPPNVPLPPIPAASASTTWPNRTCSLSMISRPPNAKGIVRDFPYPQDVHPDVLDTFPPKSRPRSKSSPLRSEMKRTSSHAPLPAARHLRLISSPTSFISDSEITDDTNPTSEEGETSHIPIALFESSYSPPVPPPIIQNFVQQYHPSTRFPSEKFSIQENSKACHNFSS